MPPPEASVIKPSSESTSIQSDHCDQGLHCLLKKEHRYGTLLLYDNLDPQIRLHEGTDSSESTLFAYDRNKGPIYGVVPPWQHNELFLNVHAVFMNKIHEQFLNVHEKA